MLFKSVKNRNETQLAYHSAYTAWNELTDGAKQLIVWRKKKVIHKQSIERFLNEDKTKLLVLNKSQNSSAYGTMQEFQITWLNNNIPTEEEWNKKSEGYHITVDLRITKTHGRIALFSF